MKEGIYYVKFSSNQGISGEGLAVFKDGKINGGDHGYLYIGSYAAKDSTVTSKLQIKRWNSSATSVFGSIPEFDLDLGGSFDGASFNVNGKSSKIPGAQIRINGKHLSDGA